MSTLLAINNLSCHYGDKAAISDLSFSLAKGDICGLLGPSGCGKTSILRAIAGFLAPTSGEIKLADQILSDAKTLMAPEHRKLGLVYQDYALFPHLNVFQNICFGIYKKPKDEQQAIAAELLNLIQLPKHETRMPSELSGGEQQRVALARSLATNPELLLLDEPFSGLDLELRRELSHAVRDILKERGTTALLVTHDQEEAFTMADTIGVVADGQLQQWGSAQNLYHEPTNIFVADFIGKGVFLEGALINSSSAETELGEIKIRLRNSQSTDTGTKIKLLLRPDNIVERENGKIKGRIEKKLFMGDTTQYSLRMPSGALLEATLSTVKDYAQGDQVSIGVQATELVAFHS